MSLRIAAVADAPALPSLGARRTRQGLLRLTPSYDLNLPQLEALLGRSAPELFEVVLHQHIPMCVVHFQCFSRLRALVRLSAVISSVGICCTQMTLS